MANEPERALNNAFLSARPVNKPIELARDLMNAPFSAKLEADPTETLRYTVRPLKKELARVNESVKDLKNEFFWV